MGEELHSRGDKPSCAPRLAGTVAQGSQSQGNPDSASCRMKIITRAEAKTRGLKRYFTGEPCCRGHVRERSVTSHQCLDCAIIYTKERRILNPEKSRAIHLKSSRKRYRRHRKKILAQQRAGRRCDPYRKQKQNAYRAKNRERIVACQRECYRRNGRTQKKWKYRHQCTVCGSTFRSCFPNAKVCSGACRTKKDKATFQYWWKFGPINPTGEAQWLRKNVAQLRAVKRYLRDRKQYPSPAEASALGLTLPT